MAQVINTNERIQAFVQYIILFVVTVSLAIVAIYFNYQVPVKVNKVLKSEIAMHRNEDWQQRTLLTQIEEITKLMDSLKTSQSNEGYINNLIDQRMSYLANLNVNDSSINGRLSNLLEKTFLDYKLTLNALKTKSSENNELNRELNKCKDRSEDIQRDLDRADLRSKQ
jgi:hypothetical protein